MAMCLNKNKLIGTQNPLFGGFGVMLVLFLFLSALLRLYHITYHDSYTDEAILAFRSIGLIDYDTSPTQTTPWQWYSTVPWWARLSFHDHPIGFFLLQYLSFKLLGVGLLAARLPSVIAGVGAVVVLYGLSRRLFNHRVGFLSALLLAVSSYHIWVSRVGLQDSVVIFLVLLALYCVSRAVNDSRWLLAWGVITGLAISTKYTCLIIFPLTVLFMILYRVRWYRERWFWYAIIAIIIGSTSVWLYNIMLYSARGHFDFQISAAFGQAVPEWSFRLGRIQAGGISDRLINFFRALGSSSSWLFNLLTITSFASIAFAWKRLRESKAGLFVIGATVLVWLWFFVIGATYRFVVMIAPFFVLLIAVFFDRLLSSNFISASRNRKVLIFAALGFFIVGEIAFTVNSFIIPRPFGRAGIAYASLNEETQNFGFNQLDVYLNNYLRGKFSGLMGEARYDFMRDLQKSHIDKVKAGGATAYPALIIYDNNINFIANLWLYQRRIVYEGWPLATADDFLKYTRVLREEYYRNQGVEEFIFILPADVRLMKEPALRTSGGAELKSYLDKKGILPEVINNRVGQRAFLIYKF